MASRQAAALIVLAAFTQLAGAPVEAQSTTPPGGPITPAAMPDLIVLPLAVQVKCVAGGSVTATIAAKVKNQGPSTADFSKIPQQVGIAASWWVPSGVNLVLQTANPQLSIAPPVKSGETRDVTLIIAGIPEFKPNMEPMQYGFSVTVDPKKGIAESSENNNEQLTFADDPCPK